MGSATASTPKRHHVPPAACTCTQAQGRGRNVRGALRAAREVGKERREPGGWVGSVWFWDPFCLSAGSRRRAAAGYEEYAEALSETHPKSSGCVPRRGGAVGGRLRGRPGAPREPPSRLDPSALAMEKCNFFCLEGGCHGKVEGKTTYLGFGGLIVPSHSSQSATCTESPSTTICLLVPTQNTGWLYQYKKTIFAIFVAQGHEEGEEVS
jgi:hypothetical protein